MKQSLGVVMLMRQFYPFTGGYQNQALRLAQEMVRRNIRIFIVTQRQGKLPAYEVYQQIPIHRVFVLRAGHLASFSYLCSSFLWMVRNRDKFQLVHANRSSSGLIAGLISFLLRKRALYKLTRGDEVDVKGFRTTLLGRVKIQCLKRTVDKFVAITKEIERDLERLGIPPTKLARIPNGINFDHSPDSSDREQKKAELGWGPETKVVTFVGRLIHAKGVDWLLETWNDVARHEKQGRLLIIGDGSERPALEAQARTLGLTDTVVFVGYQEHVPSFLAITDIFVLPSRLEGVSNALLEAMFQGLPVVVADDKLGGNREVVDDQKDGFVVSLGDREGLAKILLKLLANPELRREVGERAKRKVEERFSMLGVADSYCRLYNELLERPRT